MHFSLRMFVVALLLLGTAAVHAQTEEAPLQDEKMLNQLLADYHLLARLLIRQNRTSEALPLVQKVYELSFKPAPVAIELCDLLDQSDRSAETVGILNEQNKKDPLNLYWPRRLIVASERTGQWEKALELRVNWRKNHPSDVENIAGLVAIYRQLGRDKEIEELMDKLAMTARDKLFHFKEPPSPYRAPNQDKVDNEGIAALRLQRQFGFDEDFEQYVAAFLLRQRRTDYLETVLAWLHEKPPAGYLKSVFPEQRAVGLWLAGNEAEAAALLEKKFPALEYPGADHLLAGYYKKMKQPEKLLVRFGNELPDYLQPKKKIEPPAPTPEPEETPVEDGETGEAP